MKRILPVFLVTVVAAAGAEFRSSWQSAADRPWAGPEYWANPLQDWRVHSGRLECVAAGGDRNVFLLTREISGETGDITMSVRLGRLEQDTQPLDKGFAGFRLGIRGNFNDYRDSAVRGFGFNGGITADGRLFIGNPAGAPKITGPLKDVRLRLEAKPAGSLYVMTLTAYDAAGKRLGEQRRNDVRPEWLNGGIALVAHSGFVEATPGPGQKVAETGWVGKRLTDRGGTMRFWFRDWTVSGSKVTAHDERAFGPVLFTLYTLHRGVLKLNAQLAPVEKPGEAVLSVQRGGSWQRVASARVDPLSRTATFRVPNWDDTRDTPYRVTYGQGSWSGTVRKDPRDKPRIVAAAFTGNNDLGFPHADVVRNVSFFKPDVLVYTGDQIYERVGEYGIQRTPMEAAALDYLRKWYIFGWEYRELLKDIPSVCLPDDHDVYHGNLWGSGGRHADGEGYVGQDKGGYTMPAAWVNMVQRTQASHHPDPFDPTPVEQGITVYYSPLNVGWMSFAVVEDRKWKSAPAPTVPKAQIRNGWPQNPAYVAARDGDVPGAELLGKRQIHFLNQWAKDWSGGAIMKSVISQTIFADVATLPKEAKDDSVTSTMKVYKPGEYAEGDKIVMDHDSNGWPQTPRKEALRAIRRGLAFHIAGDQHLGSTVQYGIDAWNDAAYAICVPSVANIFPRRWFPPQPGRNPKPHSPRNTGEFLDGFGNKVTVHAVSNPFQVDIAPSAINNRAPGYGIITFDRATRRITIANWPRWVDAAKPGAKPYPGWPITIHQYDNGMSAAPYSLGAVKANVSDPVAQVIDQATGEIAYTVRAQGTSFTPKVWRKGIYTVRLFDPDRKFERVFKDRAAR